MPREHPELVGQPIGWDMFEVKQADGSITLIERAVSITDLCKIDDPIGKRQILLCFFTDQKHGPCVASLDILDLESYVLSEEVGLSMTRITDIDEETELGQLFLRRLEHNYGADYGKVLDLICPEI